MIKYLNLKSISILYLTFPLLIFLFGWLKFSLAIFTVSILCFAIYKFLKTQEKDNIKSLIIILILALIWCWFSGAGGIGFQNGDYIKHNSILSQLIAKSWPPIFNLDGQYQALVYYFGYYLPAALIGKLLGTTAAEISQFIWCYFGATLSLLWFFKLTGQKLIYPFIFLGGLDVIGKLYFQHESFNLGNHIEWWAGFGQYSSISTLLFWTPQHAISGWLFASLIYDEIYNKNTFKNIFLLLITSLIWSVFVTIGLCLFSLVAIIIRFKNFCQNILPLIFIFPILAFFYLSKNTNAIPSNFTIGHITSFYNYAAFCFLEFGAYTILAFALLYKNLDKKNLIIFIWTVVLLLLIPLYKIGAYNDFCMRTSIPILFIFWIFCIKAILTDNKYIYQKILKLILILLLITGSITSISELKRAQKYYNINFHHLNLNADFSKTMSGFSYQYTGDLNSIFFKYLAKKPE